MYEKEPQDHFRESILMEALKLVGCSSRNHPKEWEDHVFGCSPETGFDCSGFVVYVLKKSGINVPEGIRHASEFFDNFGVLTHIPQKGDLVFLSRDGMFPKHIGIYLNENEYISSQGRNGGKVLIEKLEQIDISLTSEKQLYIKSPIGFKKPTILINGQKVII